MVNRSFAQAAQLLRAAEKHREAARKLLGQCPPRSTSWLAAEVIYLAGYVAECALKALLISQFPVARHDRLVEEEFKGRIRHNLELLRHELIGKGVAWPSEQTEQLRRVRSVWSSEMRYEARRYTRDDAERVVEAAEGLFGWASGR